MLVQRNESNRIEFHAMNWRSSLPRGRMGFREPANPWMHVCVFLFFVFVHDFFILDSPHLPKKSYEAVLNLVAFFPSHRQRTHRSAVHMIILSSTDPSPFPQVLSASSLAENTHTLSWKTEYPVWKNVMKISKHNSSKKSTMNPPHPSPVSSRHNFAAFASQIPFFLFSSWAMCLEAIALWCHFTLPRSSTRR